MTRTKTQLINKTKKHIASLGYLYYMVPDAGSLILLKEGGDSNHYLMIVFTGRNRTWEHERRHFSIAEIEVETFNDVEKGIAKYLGQWISIE
jgi:hypothetical protein